MTEKRAWFYDLLFVSVLLIAGLLRFGGANWGEGFHQHPDELFLMGVLDNLRAHVCDEPSIPVDACPAEMTHWMSVGRYFDSDTSTLSPYNRGYSSFVYGNLPMTVARIALEISGNDDISRSKFFSRQLAATVDLLTIFVLYLIVSRLYGRRVGVIASAFSSFAVMQIQQSHFFTTDLFVNLFMFLGLACAVGIVNYNEGKVAEEEDGELPPVSNLDLFLSVIKNPLLYLSIGFGLMLGMAMASKINAAAMAIVLPGAFLVRYFMVDHKKRDLNADYWIQIAFFLIAGGLATIISFRIFQPYAFNGFSLNPQWIANIAAQRVQASGEGDVLWNLQWARRTHLYSFENLTTWGLGLPLGILAWAGFLFMGWRVFKGEWKHALLWGWTAFYFVWQSLQFNPTMRYQLPIYPLLCMMAAWFIFELAGLQVGRSKYVNIPAILAGVAGVTVLILTAIWAFAFQSIYLRPEPRIAASRWIFQNVPGPINLGIETETDEIFNQPVSFPTGYLIQNGIPYLTNILPLQDGKLNSITLAHAQDLNSKPAVVAISIYNNASSQDVLLGRSIAQLDSSATSDPRGPELTFTFKQPIPVSKGQLYLLKIETLGSGLVLNGSAIANETTYDWGLPFRVDGYDPYGGMYRGDFLLQVYFNDDPEKLVHMMSVLDDADYIAIPTNHQYAQITRLPERYPLTTVYYRELLGCPAEADIIKCYRNAEVGDYEGRLGFELVQTFTDYPTFGPLVINDQAAEEAFTFYDHPKVMIFKKSESYSSTQVYKTLSAVDLTRVVHLLPKDADKFVYKDLMIPEARLEQLRAGGTWSDLFDYDWLQNKYPLVGILFWYGFIFLLGLAAFPIARYALPGFGVYAYPLGRVVGLVLLAWLSWMGGSLGIPYTRLSIGAAVLIVAVIGFGLWMIRRQQFKEEWNANHKFLVLVEILFLIFFVIDLLIRLGNSDMWHPSKGGERPMDFSYFNAVLKSTSFPPYDPWFAGGYINYYYYGFVIAGTPVKLLGIVPSLAYNFILPTWFALVGMGAFTVGFNLLQGLKTHEEDENPWWGVQPSAIMAGLASSVMTILLGNLGTFKVIFDAFQKVAAPAGALSADDTFLEKWAWALQGAGRIFSTSIQHIFNKDITVLTLPIGVGEWLWNPSRIMPPGPGNEITEFPLFTFLYSDLHAHMLVIPLTLFIIAWSVSFIKSHALLSRMEWLIALLIGALFTAALKPTNTWDFYAFFPFAALAVVYTVNRHMTWNARFKLPGWVERLLFSFAFVAGLYIIGSLMYSPFDYWYGQAYGSVSHWTASHTPLSTYLTHWGLFLFVITFWLAWETREWMANTPLSSLKYLSPYRLLIELLLAVFIALLVFFTYERVVVSWLALPLAIWAGVLILRPEMPAVKRAVLMMIGTALALTLAVENIALVGDLGRMNTVFKIYMQAWILFAASSGACFVWLLPAFMQWKPNWRWIFQVGLYFLLGGAFMFTLTATTDKITDRMASDAPRTLDGITYMNYAERWENGTIELDQDYRAIRWLQDNVQGSPVIVEANCSEYRWCTRMTIYTGLPGVVGWNFHQRQQRAFDSLNVQNRVSEVGLFYSTVDLQIARDFLAKYDVKYIIVGQLERNIYPSISEMGDGLQKFEQYNGTYWNEVYHDADTTIYEVIQ